MNTEHKNAFTLAELLITLGIIGIVAAMTIPTLINNHIERQHKTTSTNFESKLGEVIRIMNAQNLIIGHDTTENFVNELSKHIRITKICEQAKECFSPKIKLTSKTSINTENIDSKYLGHSDWGTNVVGIQFASGVNALLAYNPNFSAREDTQVVKFSKGQYKNLKTVKIGTNAISVLYDVSGFEKPNTVGEDIIGINAALTGSGGVQCTSVGNYNEYCIVDFGTNYESVNCSKAGYNEEYCEGISPTTDPFSNKSFWAGANKICKDNNMRLPTQAELLDIYNLKTLGCENIPASGSYASTGTKSNGGGINLETGGVDYQSTTYQFNVMCLN